MTKTKLVKNLAHCICGDCNKCELKSHYPHECELKLFAEVKIWLENEWHEKIIEQYNCTDRNGE